CVNGTAPDGPCTVPALFKPAARAFGPTNDTLLKKSVRRLAFWSDVCCASSEYCHWRTPVMKSTAAPYVSVIMMPTVCGPEFAVSSCPRYAVAACTCAGTLVASLRV